MESDVRSMHTASISGSVRQAANLALLEVDRGLLSNNIGEQCEAIMQFPVLIEQFPLPVVITSAFLKLTDKFVSGQNIIRQCITQVMEQCTKHLHKVTNIDDIFQRICTVFHSNDPIARGLTLRNIASVFGAMAALIGDKKIVLQSVLKGLDSNHHYEQNSAIESARELCQHSRTFAVGICNKISSMIQDVATSMILKLKLVHILEYMYHDIDLAFKVRQLCVDLLSAYPSVDFVIIVIETLTKLAMATCVHIRSQIEFLISIAERERRKAVRMKIFCNLQKLSHECAHSWNSEDVEAVLRLSVSTSRINEKLKLLSVIKSIAASSSSHHVRLHRDSLLVMCNDTHFGAVSRACNVLTSLLPSNNCEEVEEMICILESVFIMYSQGSDLGSFKILCSSLARIAVDESTAVQVVNILSSAVCSLDQSKADICCRVIGIVARKCTNVPKGVSENLLKVLDKNIMLLYPVCMSLMRLHSSCLRTTLKLSCSDIAWLEKRLMHYIHHMSCGDKYDIIFQIAREASCEGFHRFAGELYHSLACVVEQEDHYYWLLSLQNFSKSCFTVTKFAPTQSTLNDAIQEGLSAQQYLKASGRTDSFLYDFVHIYILYLRAFSHLCTSCAILNSTSLHSITKRSFVEFQEVAKNFDSLISSNFDADQQTIDVLLELCKSCKFVCYILKAVVSGSNSLNRSHNPLETFEIESEMESFSKLRTLKLAILQDTAKLQDKLKEPVALLASCLSGLLEYPLKFPVMIFGSKQRTRVQLITVPVLSEQECVSVPTERPFSLTVEGIVSQTNACYRVPSQAIINVILTSSTSAKISTSKGVKLNGDYFKACFSLAISSTETNGSLLVTLVDETGRQWNTSPNLSFLLQSS